MSTVLTCSGTWNTSPEGYPFCTGTLSAVESGQPAMTLEDSKELTNAALVLFCVVFAFLALKKVLS